MKKLPALVMALCMLIGVCGAKAAEAGETAEVSFSMLTNPENAVDILIVLEYDHEALELVPNYIFNRDRKVARFNEFLSAVFRIRKDARPGTYTVTIRVLEAVNIDSVPISRLPAYSEAVITVKSSPVEVPVYYMRQGDGSIVATDSVTLAAGQTVEVKANPPKGWVISGEQSMPVTVKEDGLAIPSSVTFWLTKVVLATGTPIPTPTPAPTPVPVKVGEYITFGHYEQDNNTGNGKEPIEWLVLKVSGNQALVISRYGLDAQPYNFGNKNVTWETCSLRTWLNGEFLNNAFTTREQTAIIMTTADNSAGQGYSEWNTDGGNDTKDRIFLLSYAEAWSYFGSDSVRQSEATRYAEGRGAYTSGGKCWWWLRSPGFHQRLAARVYTDGSLNSHGVFIDSGCVRPALWINPDSGIF